jgi:hypothetical protein
VGHFLTRIKVMKRNLYEVTFEVSIVFTSNSEDIETVRSEVRSLLNTDIMLRDEIEDSSIASITKIKAGSALPEGYDEKTIPWGSDDDLTIGEVLSAENG